MTLRLDCEKMHGDGAHKAVRSEGKTHVDTLGGFQLQTLYNVSLKLALSHLALYHCSTGGAYAARNMKMNLLCR